MSVLPMSPRLPGVTVLSPDANGPEYKKWRRGIESAFTAKGTWGHCDGASPMPMPDKVGAVMGISESQPSLLEERRAWVKLDRDVKLDIFLSISDDIKMDVFEVGPPLPPSAMTAKEMIAALDEHFQTFKFEEYHHVYCHFLNLHIDQYPSLEQFNSEFLATLEDMADHGFPLHNIQACSAYFSKLRCTQNPWVVKKLENWDMLDTTPLLADLIKEVPPWIVIRPLALKNASTSQSASDSHSEVLVGSHEGNDSSDALSDIESVTSESSREQEITVHASYEDLTEAFPLPTTKLHPAPGHRRKISKSKTVSTNNSVVDITKLAQPSPPPLNRPLPPLPSDASTTRSRSMSPKPALLTVPPPTPSPRPSTSSGRPASPALQPTTARPSTPTQLQKALLSPPLVRPSTPELSPASFPRPPRSSPLATQSSKDPLQVFPKRQDSSNSSTISLPLQGARISESSTHPANLSSTPLQGSPTRTSTDSEKERKRSWSIRARLSSRRIEVTEMI